MNLPLATPCPGCKTSSVVIDANRIYCTTCSFSHRFNCPICETPLDPAAFKQEKNGQTTICSTCKRQIRTSKIKYLIENTLRLDYDTRCHLCNSPTIHLPHIPGSHRCYYFPKCSGQGTLFEQVEETLVFLDFETTGLEIGRNSIIEIGAVKIDEEGCEHIFQTFVQPSEPVDEKITKITGITPEMLVEAPDLKTSTQKLLEFIDTSVIIAHNAEFDIPWMVTSAIRHALPLKQNLTVCTLKWAKLLNEPFGSLSTLTKKYQIHHANAHRALADAMATKELYLIFQNKKLKERPEQQITGFVPFCEKLINRYSNFIQA